MIGYMNGLNVLGLYLKWKVFWDAFDQQQRGELSLQIMDDIADAFEYPEFYNGEFHACIPYSRPAKTPTLIGSALDDPLVYIDTIKDFCHDWDSQQLPWQDRYIESESKNTTLWPDTFKVVVRDQVWMDSIANIPMNKRSNTSMLGNIRYYVVPRMSPSAQSGALTPYGVSVIGLCLAVNALHTGKTQAEVDAAFDAYVDYVREFTVEGVTLQQASDFYAEVWRVYLNKTANPELASYEYYSTASSSLVCPVLELQGGVNLGLQSTTINRLIAYSSDALVRSWCVVEKANGDLTNGLPAITMAIQNGGFVDPSFYAGVGRMGDNVWQVGMDWNKSQHVNLIIADHKYGRLMKVLKTMGATVDELGQSAKFYKQLEDQRNFIPRL